MDFSSAVLSGKHSTLLDFRGLFFCSIVWQTFNNVGFPWTFLLQYCLANIQHCWISVDFSSAVLSGKHSTLLDFSGLFFCSIVWQTFNIVGFPWTFLLQYCLANIQHCWISVDFSSAVLSGKHSTLLDFSGLFFCSIVWQTFNIETGGGGTGE